MRHKLHKVKKKKNLDRFYVYHTSKSSTDVNFFSFSSFFLEIAVINGSTKNLIASENKKWVFSDGDVFRRILWFCKYNKIAAGSAAQSQHNFQFEIRKT